jgi:transglutaminase-like putative cysteine protease
MLDDQLKWEYLKGIPAIDMLHPIVKTLALKLLEASGGNAKRLAQLIHTVARDWIRQTSDVTERGGEDIAGLTREPTSADAIDALKRGEDDCDAKARLFVALCLASGLNARMVPRWMVVPVSPITPQGKTLTHVSAEVYLDGKWQSVELTLARARLGETGEQIPKEKDGKWKLS